MSWVVDDECYSCSVPGCQDRTKVQEAADALNAIEHLGAGTLRMNCFKHQPQVRIGHIVHHVPSSGEHVGKSMPAVVMGVYGEDKLDLAVITGQTVNGYNILEPVFDVPYSAKNEFGTWHHLPK